MIEIKVSDPTSQESFNKAIKIFNRKVQNAGIIQEVKERRYYKKQSTIRNEKNRDLKRKLRNRKYDKKV